MATVHADEKDCLVVLSKQHDPTIKLAVDDARQLRDALHLMADTIDESMKKSGKLIAAKTIVSDVWEAAVGYFDGGVAIRFNQGGNRIPLPPAVARALANRIQAAINAAETGFSVEIAGHKPLRSFSSRPVVL